MAIPQRPAPPLSPPLVGAGPEAGETGVVRQHRKVTYSHQKKVSVLSKRIMARVLEQIKFGATELAAAYTIGVLDLTRGTDLDPRDVYKYGKAAVNELADVRWNFEDLEEKVYIPRHLLNTTLPRAQASRCVDGLITIVLNPALAPYFVNLASNYTTYNLTGYLGLGSWYSMRLFELLASWQDKGVWYVGLAEYRQLMDCGPVLDKLDKPRRNRAGEVLMKYPATKDLIVQTVQVAQRELVGTAYAFDYVAVLEERQGRGRRRIARLEFHLQRPRRSELPAEWLENPALRSLLTGLRRFAVTEENLLQYWDVLQPAGLGKLLREWQLKENGAARIESKLRYCNAALVREGKRLLAARRQALVQAQGRNAGELFGAGPAPDWLLDADQP